MTIFCYKSLHKIITRLNNEAFLQIRRVVTKLNALPPNESFLLVNPSKTNRNTIVVPCTFTVSRVLVRFKNKRDFPILRVDYIVIC